MKRHQLLAAIALLSSACLETASFEDASGGVAASFGGWTLVNEVPEGAPVFGAAYLVPGLVEIAESEEAWAAGVTLPGPDLADRGAWDGPYAIVGAPHAPSAAGLDFLAPDAVVRFAPAPQDPCAVLPGADRQRCAERVWAECGDRADDGSCARRAFGAFAQTLSPDLRDRAMRTADLHPVWLLGTVAAAPKTGPGMARSIGGRVVGAAALLYLAWDIYSYYRDRPTPDPCVALFGPVQRPVRAGAGRQRVRVCFDRQGQLWASGNPIFTGQGALSLDIENVGSTPILQLAARDPKAAAYDAQGGAAGAVIDPGGVVAIDGLPVDSRRDPATGQTLSDIRRLWLSPNTSAGARPLEYWKALDAR